MKTRQGKEGDEGRQGSKRGSQVVDQLEAKIETIVAISKERKHQIFPFGRKWSKAYKSNMRLKIRDQEYAGSQVVGGDIACHF